MAGVSYFNVYVTHVVETVECQEKSNYCNLIFWGQKDRGLSAKMEEQIAACNFDASPRPLLTDLKKEKHFCALVNNSWVRATISDYSIDRNGNLEVFCIDYGHTVMVPLACIKLIPSTLPFISSCHLLATKFLLADVVIEKGIRGKEPVLQYLQKNIANKNVKAVSLGIRDDFEGVRIYSYDVLVAKLLVESFLGTPAATYLDAIKQPVPNHRQLSVTSISPPPMTKNSYNRASSVMSVSHKMLNAASSQSKPIPGVSYTASCLEMNVIHTVMVTYVQNGPQKFVIQRKSSDAVEKLTNLSKKLSEFAALNSKTLVNVDRGTPCIAISSRDKLFHRGVITLVEDVRYAQVYFVDYGYSELVDLQSLFEIPADFISIELFAYRVTLEDAASLMTFDKVSENFTRLVLYQTFKCHVTGETMPQSVILMDDAGRTVKELVLASVADSRQPLNISELLKTAPLSPITAAGNIKVATVEVGAVEDLFVTCVGSPGKFFGQFERRPVAELEALKSELQSTYSSCIPGQPSQIPLLYADVKSHIGDYGVIKWSSDGHFYRVQIVEEFAHDVAITFVDYGNNIRVCRQEIWAPASSLKWFSRPSFGINCIVPGVTLTENEWALLVNDKSVRVKLGQPINKVYPATIVNMLVNNVFRPLSACSNLSPIAQEFDPVRGASVVPQVTNRKLEFDAPGQSGLRKAIPNIVVENGQMPNHSLLEDSWGMPVLKNKALEDSWGIPMQSTKAITVEPPRQISDRVSSVSSTRSSASRNPEERMDWESAEPKELPREPTPISRPLEIPKRVMPISQPTKLVYPHQTGLEGATKTLEIVFVEDPNSFYCHLIEAVPLLEKLMDNLATAYLAAPKEPLGCIEVGVACVAQYTDDNNWYRGQILNVGATEVEVLFVDYGNKQRTPTTLLKAIEQEFVKLPPQAYHCSLAGVQDCSRSWTLQDKTRLEEAGMGKPLKTTVSDHRENDKYLVRLVDEGSRPQVVINDLFAPPREIVPVPDVFSYSSLPTSDLTNVNVVWFSNVGRFFLSPDNLESYQPDLDQLEEHYSALSSDELVEDSPCVGLPCVVKFKDDGRYYRSEILSIRGSFANVIFVDYGNEQETALKELKRIHPRFLKFPQLTWQCRLNNVIMPDSEIFYSQDLKDHIKACFPEGLILGARFHEPTGGVYPVDLAVPDIGDAANYLVKNKVLCRHNSCMGQEKEVKFPPKNFDFVPDEVISTTAFLPFVKTPLEFWIQLESESVEAIMEQSDKLATEPDFLNNKSNFIPVVGKSCLAFFAEDERWYRATVESVEQNSAIVYYVDYGNTCSVGLEHLRDLPPLLAEKPPMAFKCCLAGAESPISKEVTGAFLALALDLVATVKVVKVVNEILHVRLCNTADGVDLGEKIQLPTKPVELEVYVGYSISPDRFWVQRKEDENRIAEIQNQLGQELQGSNMGSFQLQGHPVAGQMYAVFHPVYENLYRALVKSFDSFSGLAEIQFVDYGDDHKVSAKDFLHLPENLKKIPPMAFESCLNLQSRPKHWPEEALKYFISICSPEIVFQAKLGVKANGIQQIDSLQAQDENVIEVLNSKIKQSQLEQTGRVFGILESVSKSLKQVETQMHPVIRPSTELINDMNGIPGQVISSKAIVVCLNSPTAVWLHLDPTAADDIMNSIKQYTQQPEFAQIRPLEPVAGVSCLALFPDDQLWYRAVVESVDQSSVTVNYVDFGNSSPVGQDQLRPIPSALVVKPALAFKCALDGADRVTDNLPSTRKCQDALFDQLLSVTFVEKTQKHIFVRLRDSDGHDLNEKLGLPAAPTNVRLENQRTNASSTLVSTRPIPGAEDVRVSYIKSAGMFWIQRESNCEEIEQIRDTLRPLDSNDSSNVPPLSVKENVLYAVMHPEYNRFYRARANQINGDCAEVYFLDIGYTDWVPLSSIRPCPAILKYIPAMANECTFRSPIYPDQYSEEIRKAFSDATEGVVCQAVFSGPQPSQSIQCIESLFAKGVNVGNLLYNLISSIAPQSGTSGGFGNLPLFPSKQQRGL